MAADVYILKMRICTYSTAPEFFFMQINYVYMTCFCEVRPNASAGLPGNTAIVCVCVSPACMYVIWLRLCCIYVAVCVHSWVSATYIYSRDHIPQLPALRCMRACYSSLRCGQLLPRLHITFMLSLLITH